MLANIAIAAVATITIWIVLIVIACIFIDRGNFVNLDGGER